MICLPEIKTAELSTYGNFAVSPGPLPRFACWPGNKANCEWCAEGLDY